MTPINPNVRVRFRFAKLGKVRFTSHRDVARLWERALRRAELPVASTEGFSPRPKVHFGLALPTGYESLGEYIDVDLQTEQVCDRHGSPIALGALPQLLSPLLPIGLDVTNAEAIARSERSLQEAVTSCSWTIEVPDLAADVGGAPAERQLAVNRALAAETLLVERERKGKTVVDDIRPGIRSLEVAADGSLLAELATQPRGLRPSELLVAMAAQAGRDTPYDEGLVRRTQQWIELDGARREPLPPSATRAPHAEARAS